MGAQEAVPSRRALCRDEGCGAEPRGSTLKCVDRDYYGYFDTDLRNLVLNRATICLAAALRLVFLNVSDGK